MQRLAIVLFGAALAMAANGRAQTVNGFAETLDAKWDYGKPAASEERFRAELAKWPPDSVEALEIRTQIARALGLQRRFDDANATLDVVERALPNASAHLRVRYLLERGRTFNSLGAPQRAVPLFAEALALAERGHDEFYAVDAAHMLGIAAPEHERLDWNLKALALADAATDARARGWRASLYHNIGWTYFDAGDAAKALAFWQKALALRETAGNADRLRVAKWTVARGYRAVGRLDDAERIQRALVVEFDAIGEPDGYVYEELAEIALARGDAAAAQPWAAKAHALLKDDPDVAGDGARLAHLAAVAGGQAPPPKR
jgi:tetratricopeptide (TPR) repeat protein